MTTCPTGAIFVISLKIFTHQSIHIIWLYSVWRIYYTSTKLQKYSGVRAHFLQKYERNTGRITSADSQKFIFFKNGKNCFFSNAITQFLDGPFNGLSGLFKLQFLSSDSFFYQLGSENFILARNYKKVRVRNHCWSNYMGEITKIQVFTGDFLETPVHMGVPVFIRPGSSHCVFYPIEYQTCDSDTRPCLVKRWVFWEIESHCVSATWTPRTWSAMLLPLGNAMQSANCHFLIPG